MIKAGIVGGTGYTGVELLRILLQHPSVEVTAVTSRADEGKRLDQCYPNLIGRSNLVFSSPDSHDLEKCDVVFFATPHTIAMKTAERFLNKKIKVIDLSADFRLKNAKLWEDWYGEIHTSAGLLETAVYGLPEVNRGKIKSAELIACPGCYPTAVQLGFLPLLENGLVDTDTLIADVKSGVSGAGRKASQSILMSETGESFKAYGVQGHRHLPEIEQGLREIARKPINLTFVPHLTPMIRGIHATLYGGLKDNYDIKYLHELYQKRYQNEEFVKILPPNTHPDTREVRGSNYCHIGLYIPQGGRTVVVLTVIDNLVKGASGQAVQNMNLMFSLDEVEGLKGIALFP